MLDEVSESVAPIDGQLNAASSFSLPSASFSLPNGGSVADSFSVPSGGAECSAPTGSQKSLTAEQTAETFCQVELGVAEQREIGDVSSVVVTHAD